MLPLRKQGSFFAFWGCHPVEKRGLMPLRNEIPACAGMTREGLNALR